ncbi:M1 family metallopeptidase [Oleiagrimonas sp. MCCC 1A03011]|uniref:M1 family metallopeptidase n=1 Tax=Oleiagrimonas sp. MCCC 1A03011 TaxID=1926883 RepID=UPI000DC3F7B7|nr:M1 family metallopeptidase [Oleiagrimonas sp. MCCC 1A03011]RAP57471.1 peptidase M1 [Oleiagrimonas sp. MCCC 1A03011]
MAVCCIGLSTAALAAPPPAAPTAAASAPATASTAALAPIPFVSPHAANIRTASAPDAWGGPRTPSDATLSDRVTTYAIQATLDPDKHTVDAHQVMTWRNRSDRPVDKIYLHMYLNAFEGPGSTFFTERRMYAGSGHSRGAAKLKKGEWGYIDLKKVQQNGQEVTWRYVQPDNGPKTDHTVVEMDLPQAVPAHGTLTLNMDFHDQLPRVVERTGWWGKFHLVAQWFPKIAVLELPGERGATRVRWNAHEFHYHSEFYADYGNYDVKLTVPKGYTVGAVGHEASAPVDADGKVTYHFKQTDVEDFAWVAAPGYKTMDTTWTGPGSPKVKVRVIYPPEYKVVAEPTMKATTDALTYFSDTLGPYPYKTVTAVIPPYNATEAGGMEYPTFFTAEHSKEYTKGTFSQYWIDFVTIHEFGHGYFMGILGSNEFEEPMLDEGMNEYWDDRMLADRKQGIDVTKPWMKKLGFQPVLGAFAMERASGVLGINFPADSLDANSWDRLSNSSYGSVYSRTASTMRTIENLVGREAMGKAMKLYYERWKFRHPSAADLRDALAEGTGRPALIHQIFDSQVYGTQRVDARVVDVDSAEQLPQAGTVVKDGKRVTVTEKQVDKQIADARAAWKKAHKDAKHGGPYPWLTTVTVRRTGAPVPRRLEVKFADGSSETVKWDDDSRWKRFTFLKPVKAVSAELDPKRELYLDANKLNDSYRVKKDGSASSRWTADAQALLQTFYTFVGTL